MPRLRNVQSGAVVSCSDETAARLGSDWQPVEESKAPAKKSAASRPTKS